ncbi:LacI family DNA-binding transcriptional regulator [Paraburkholderia sp. DD10]|jgi:DNA-binding LacI/PurR family transcriptional regulator|uniref:DNA-binding LacI/PurR family transcriptional regulator n=1 Tax=Paraburkholderia terricola TaxID=169427 RepID=A0A1M6N572_9BURK|nr:MULTISPECIES: LacI family DNA-binding transcriptional regulator [Paraburkholderia]ORC51699.1 LacI family transcriptional regulator [Burkholderia sp. A27]AXE95823.1 LacI family transcriptional regulator [Paraburkholderia terricola]MDR6407161.1 DNA-binding LacI/PurR family transcriptional regulator [Paraburkholderia terricola]MDR6479161.1 DNA-binding LacI/PurR family transcriptional regulator [Paraburkholderia terricola]SDO73545.1 transcriptional regulator, LacI family [Paraburkholderia sedim
MVTLSEVAKRAHVTAATVSNVLRNREKVRPETAERVLKAIADLGYRPNLNARALAEGRSSTLALMLSNISNPFYPEFVLAAERAARKAGRFLMVCNTDDDAEIGRAYLNQIAGTLADGVLVMNTDIEINDLCASARHSAPILLAMWEHPETPPALPCIAVDFARAGALAARHLLELGHREIGLLIGDGCGGLQDARSNGFRAVMREAGIETDAAAVLQIRDSIDAGYAACMQLMTNRPHLTAIFATNDLLAIGAAQALITLGRAVPDDVSVIGITDIQLAHQVHPALTTVAIQTAAIAELAIESLIRLIETPERQPSMVLAAPPELVVRASTGVRRRE